MSEPKHSTKDEFLAHGIEIPAEEILASTCDPEAPAGRTACVFFPEPELEPYIGFEVEDHLDDLDSVSSNGSQGECISRLQAANHAQYLRLNQLTSAHPQARSMYEQLASHHAWDLDWHRTLHTYAHTQSPASPGAIPRGSNLLPHPRRATTVHDPRPYLLIPAFELVCPRDVAPLVDRPPLQGVWLSVQPDAIAVNFMSALEAFQAIDMLVLPPRQGFEGNGSDGSTETLRREWNGLFTEAIHDVVRWCAEHMAEMWRAGELEARWTARAVESINRTVELEHGNRPPPRGLERAVVALVQFVVGWRAVREVEVWEKLVTDEEDGAHWGLGQGLGLH
ncbi:hypothetical protein SLS55_008799 [Diplodia seriata]|uniref:Uncharacterized protein n=2 Tax=Diplodia seriata TaxID=420778 RepID=A0ABR3CAA2_9PEZI